MKSEIRVLICCLGLAGCQDALAAMGDFVDPFIGTSGTGHTSPAACVPFGLVQAGPDTGTADWDHCSGYRFEDREIYGFSQTHLNGTGCEDLGDVLIAPFTDGPIEKGEETASPGFYSVTFPSKGIKTEVTASEHVGFYRFSSCDRLFVDCQWGIAHDGRFLTNVISQTASLEGGFFTGERETQTWNYRKMSFAISINRRIVQVELLAQTHPKEKGRRYVLHLEKDGAPLLVKVAISAKGGIAGAKENLMTEIPGWDFDATRKSARQKWDEILDSAVVEGTVEQKKAWCTSLYHLCIQPNNIADSGKKPFYSTFSCWDTFRAAGPFYTILCPDKVAGFVDSMLDQCDQTGFLPIWTLWGRDNQCMIGSHSVPMIVDAYLKALPIDVNRAYRQIKETLTQRHEARRKENWDIYDRYGYYPFDLIRGESVSRTLECGYDDWCAAQMSKKLGYDEDYEFFMERAGRWKNVFDSSIGLMRGKDRYGKWRTPFDPYSLGHGADLANDFTEGNAFQYSWHVMQDPVGLIDAMGGNAAFCKRLDELFAAPEKVEGLGSVVDVTGLIGQYVHGNEPSHHVIYFYPQVGHPERAAERIREVFDKFYLPKPDGLCGNDDCGQMSAWYLFSAMGFYPFNPCGGEYVIGAPQVPCVTLNIANGKIFTVSAKNLSKENKYVKSVMLNGQKITNWKIRHADIMNGGELVFEMGK